MDVPDVSVVILTYNARDLLLNCVESVVQASEGMDVEIIVSDNGSNDGTQDAIHQRFPNVVLVENNANLGYSGCNNRGIEVSHGRHVLILNPDTVLHKDNLRLTYEYAESHPECGVVGCKAFYSDGSIQRTWFPTLTLFYAMWIGFGLQKLLPFDKFNGRWRFSRSIPDQVVKVERIMGCYLWIPRAVIDKVGMFDEEFFIYSEEEDLCRRIRDHGWEIHYYPIPRMTHYEGMGGTKHIAKRARINANVNKARFIKKHRGPVALFVFRLIWTVSLYLRVLIRLPLAIFSRYHRQMVQFETISSYRIWMV